MMYIVTDESDDIWCPLCKCQQTCVQIAWVDSFENAHSIRIAGIYPARQVWQGVFLGTIPVVHQAPAVKVCGFCDLDVHIASYGPCCKGIPAVVSSNDCGIYMEMLTAARILIPLQPYQESWRPQSSGLVELVC